MSLNRKLKILCLHGYRQDADVFKAKMGGFRKSLKNLADLVFISAPHIIPPESYTDTIYGNNLIADTECVKEGRSWWFNSDDHTFHSQRKSEWAIGFNETLECIKDAFKSFGPFDGILGFSQGASLVSLICGLKENNEFSYNFHFVILVAGFKSLVDSHQHLYQQQFTTDSLHIIGENDTCIPKEVSISLAENFYSPTIIYHEGGHLVPTHCDTRKEYKTFLEQMLDKISNMSSHSNI